MATIASLGVRLFADVADFVAPLGKLPAVADDVVDKVESKFEGMDLRPAAAAAGVAAGAAVVAGALEGFQREAVGDKLAASLDLSESAAARAGDVAGSVYANSFGDSIEQVHEAVGAVLGTISRDLSDADLEGLSSKALALADVFSIDVTEAVTRAGILMKTGLAADANEAFDLLTAGLQEIAPGLRDELGDATTEYSRFFAALGLTGSQMFALFAQADDQFALDKSGDAIKEFTIRATDMSALSKQAFKNIGLNAKDMSDRILAGGDTARGAFEEIVDGLLGIKNPTKQANTAIALFGTPLEDLSTGEIAEFLQSLDKMDAGLGDVAAAAQEMADVAGGNASTKIEGFRRKIETLLARVVEAPGILGDAAAGAAAMGMAISPLAPLLTGLAIIFQTQLAAVASSVASTTAAVVVAVARQVAAWTLLGVQALLHAAKVAAAWLIAMGPVGIVIAIVVGLVVLIVKNWSKVKEVTRAAWNAIVGFLSSAWSSIKSGAMAALTGLVGFITRWHPLAIMIRAARAALPTALSFFRALPGKIINALEGLVSRLYNFGVEALQSLWDGLKSKAGDLLGWLDGLKDDIAGKLDPRNWFSTPEEHYRMLFGDAFAAIADEGQKALGMIDRAARDVAAASVPETPTVRTTAVSFAASTAVRSSGRESLADYPPPPGGKLEIVVLNGDRQAADWLDGLFRRYSLSGGTIGGR